MTALMPAWKRAVSRQRMGKMAKTKYRVTKSDRSPASWPALDRRPRSSTARAIFFRVFLARAMLSAQAAGRKGMRSVLLPPPPSVRRVANAKSVTERFC